MTGFVLIHGAYGSGRHFDAVADILRDRGHAVLSPTLPGMGGTEEELRAATLDAWADFALGLCRQVREETGGRVVLAGHSRGGIVISAAAEKDPAAMDHLAYISALMVPEADRLPELAAIMPSHPEMLGAISSVHNGAGTVLAPEAAMAVFAHECPPEYLDKARETLNAEPAAPLMTPVTVTAGRWGTVARTYIAATRDRTLDIAGQRAMIALSPGTATIEIESDHSPYFSAPEALAQALETL